MITHLSPGCSFSGLIQIAGVHDLAEANMLIEAGVHAVGFPLRLPVNAEDCSEAEAAEIAATIRHRAVPMCICYLTTAEDVITFCRQLGMLHVQLHGDILAPELARIKTRAPELFIIKSLVVRTDGSNVKKLEETLAAATPFVDAFITDTHDPATGADGATGKVHDWETSRKLVTLSQRPVILAGGLTPDNVAAAINIVRPAGVDAHTGVEGPDGRKNRNLISQFIIKANKVFTDISATN